MVKSQSQLTLEEFLALPDYEIAGCRVSLEFPTVKLLDYETQWEILEQTTNPFGVVVMAHLKTKATQRDPNNRLQWKLS